MNIFIVCDGYNYEGESIQGCFKSEKSANDFVEKFKKSSGDYRSNNWTIGNNERIWENGSRYIIIYKMELED